MNLHHLNLSKPLHDMLALGAATLATLTAHAVSDWLQVVVLILTIVFLALGIAMRYKRLREDDPTKD